MSLGVVRNPDRSSLFILKRHGTELLMWFLLAWLQFTSGSPGIPQPPNQNNILKESRQHSSTYMGPTVIIWQPLQAQSIYRIPKWTLRTWQVQVHDIAGYAPKACRLHYWRQASSEGLRSKHGPSCPKGPCTAHLRTLVPKTILGIVFGTRVLEWAVHGPFGMILGAFRNTCALTVFCCTSNAPEP